jgi:hypothetical protein
MKKSELKFGQKVVWRNGEEQIYFPNQYATEYNLISLGIDGWDKLSDWDNDFKEIKCGDKAYDIVSVWDCGYNISGIFTDPKKLPWKCVWESKGEIETEEISAQEAMNRLEKFSGKKIKIVSQ